MDDDSHDIKPGFRRCTNKELAAGHPYELLEIVAVVVAQVVSIFEENLIHQFSRRGPGPVDVAVVGSRTDIAVNTDILFRTLKAVFRKLEISTPTKTLTLSTWDDARQLRFQGLSVRIKLADQ